MIDHEHFFILSFSFMYHWHWGWAIPYHREGKSQGSLLLIQTVNVTIFSCFATIFNYPAQRGDAVKIGDCSHLSISIQIYRDLSLISVDNNDIHHLF